MRPGAGLILVAKVARAVPEGFAWWLGRLLGGFIGSLPIRDVKRAREHLARAFPDQDAAWVRWTTTRCFAHFGGMALWTLATLEADQARLARQVVVEDRATFREIDRVNRTEGMIGFSGHLGNWELLARLAHRFIGLTAIGKKMRSPAAEAFVAYLRTSTGNEQLLQQDGIRPCLRHLRRKRVLASLVDQDVPALPGIFVPWFGTPAYTPSGPGLLVAATGCPVFSAFMVRKGGRWVYHLSPVRRYDPTLPRDELVRRVIADATAYQERLVRRHPEQWAWWHKRWRTRPSDRNLDTEGTAGTAGPAGRRTESSEGGEEGHEGHEEARAAKGKRA